jgi:hypothetical protein
MPIRLTWIPPTQQGSGIIGYKLYKSVNPTPLVHTHPYRAFDGNTTTFDDYEYDRRLLEITGYLYKITAFTDQTESNFQESNTVLVQFSFEDFVHGEVWDDTCPLPEAPILRCQEELWTDPWEYYERTNPILLWTETWEGFELTTPVLLWTEGWEG